MTALLLFVSLILGLSVYFLVAPFYIEVDTTRDLYRLRFHRLASLSLVVNEAPALVLDIAGWKKELAITGGPAKKESVAKEQEPAQQKSRRRNVSYHQVNDLLRSFKIKTFYLDVDLGDRPLNGMLFPCFYWLSRYSGKTLRINFNGNNVIIIVAKNNIARMSGALIGSLVKTNPS